MISILLSTYNGEKYLSEQLDSILQQSYQNFIIYIRDDGSNDNTLNIIMYYVHNFPSKIKLVDDKVKHRGAKLSFIWLMSHIESDYYMFCDQDDVWLPNKIELSIDKLSKLENIYPKSPILVHTEMYVTNSNLEIISSSLYRMMKINPKYVNHFNYMGVCCCAPGCSMIFNKRSRDVSINYDNDLSIIPMHDWWVAINTARDGYVSYIIEPTMLYRQHGKNVLGATCVDLNYFVNKIKNIKQVFISYKRELKWLNLVNYGKWYKYIFYKIMYTIIRQF